MMKLNLSKLLRVNLLEGSSTDLSFLCPVAVPGFSQEVLHHQDTSAGHPYFMEVFMRWDETKEWFEDNKIEVGAFLLLVIGFIIAVLMMIQPAHAESITVLNNSGMNTRAIKNASAILTAVKHKTGINVDLGDLWIVVEKSRAQVMAECQRLHPSNKTQEVSFYDFKTNTIYTYARSTLFYDAVTAPILAHEFTHALQDHLLGHPWPQASAEVLPQWVDSQTAE